jgi:TetR/AcrR family transcriptional regulator, regulator of cefoperazone and chloramphenicol sensitivity
MAAPDRLLVQSSEVTASARIRNAALAGFANDGVSATTIRSVARAAGVSAGLVQHHFPTKQALRHAVDSYVLSLAANAFGDLLDPARPPDPDELGDRIAAFVRDHPTALRYVARSVAEGDEPALEIFDAFVGMALAQTHRLADEGLLHPRSDVRWLALHTVVLNLGTVLFEAAVSRHLPGSFLSPEQLERWKASTRSLFGRGVYRPDRPEAR